MTIKVYVEGGGDHNKALAMQCRRGFSEFFRKSGLEGRMPAIVVCGGRDRAFQSFQTSHEGADPNELPVLLVDSEAPVTSRPWEHVRFRAGDGWQRPADASDDQIHFMVQAMEAWFHADRDALERFYGQGFRQGALSPRAQIDDIAKSDLFSGLKNATRECQKGEYSKGEHSFKILALIHPQRVRTASPAHCGRLLDLLDARCSR